MKTRPPIWRKPLAVLLAAAAAGATFCLYLQGDVVFDLASRLWSCL
jgi:hypothetical protein